MFELIGGEGRSSSKRGGHQRRNQRWSRTPKVLLERLKTNQRKTKGEEDETKRRSPLRTVFQGKKPREKKESDNEKGESEGIRSVAEKRVCGRGGAVHLKSKGNWDSEIATPVGVP